MFQRMRMDLVNRLACVVVGCIYLLLVGMFLWFGLEYLLGSR